MGDDTDTKDNAAAIPPARFIGGKPREVTVPLDYHIEYDGKVYTAITVKRLTVAAVEAFIEEIKAAGKGNEEKVMPRLPMFDAPFAVLDALDCDDDDRLQKVVTDFLPRRLRMVSAPDPQSGVPSQASSPPSMDGAVKT